MPARKLLSTAAAIVVAATLLTGAAPAPAHNTSHNTSRTSGHEAFHGFLLATGVSGDREVVLTRVVARGVFDGVGHIVEAPNRPGDPDNVVRDDLVFRAGAMHLVSTNHSFRVHVDPRSCEVSARIRQTAEVTGGTGTFRHAYGTFRGGVRAFGVAPRTPDGSCEQNGALLHEIDFVRGRGRLSY